MMDPKHTICLLGAPGAGKSTIQEEFLQKYGYQLFQNITTRPARPDDFNTKSVSRESFGEHLKENKLANHLSLKTADGSKHHYGIVKPEGDELLENFVCDVRPGALRAIKEFFEKEIGTHQIISVLIDVSEERRLERVYAYGGEEAVKRITNRPVLSQELEGCVADIMVNGDQPVEDVIAEIQKQLTVVLK